MEERLVHQAWRAFGLENQNMDWDAFPEIASYQER